MVIPVTLMGLGIEQEFLSLKGQAPQWAGSATGPILDFIYGMA